LEQEFQAILRIFLRNLRGCNIGVTDWKGFIIYAVEMVSGELIYRPSFIKICSGIQMLIEAGTHIRHTDTQTQAYTYANSKMIS
jgi:hypothetical protein